MVECYLQKIVEFITNKCPSSFIKIINLHLDVTRVNAGSVTKSTANLNHAFPFVFAHLKNPFHKFVQILHKLNKVKVEEVVSKMETTQIRLYGTALPARRRYPVPVR